MKLPQSRYFGHEQYPTLESKAAIIFYTLNKKHLFLNGNKRISVACLLVFLLINDKFLKAAPGELAEKALWVARTSFEHEFADIKESLERWIRARIVDHRIV